MILNGKLLADKIIIELKEKINRSFLQVQRAPKLAIIQVGNNLASNSYIKSKILRGKQSGILVELHRFEDDVQQREILQFLETLNSDPSVDGIIIQQPLPPSLNIKELMNHIDYNKDADGFSNYNAGKLFLGETAIRPATPFGIILLLKEYNINVTGLNACVIGRSNIVGMPIAKMLLDLNATVTICHSKTKNLSLHTKKADLIICAIGQPKFLTAEMVKKGCIIIDVGINRLEGNLVGDVDYEALVKKASFITPVPGGVGPLTVVSLLSNTYQLYCLHNNLKFN
ncbi:MAG: bifunctional 5,10-methylenetetrahydrofolate dehydrogenase/5,10-methenyltetrahydrofolate cyclohydrolase [Acholeplasmatales bacterium]|jgi:methylenetetrahydrofolate dehydrogenase (NADP+)/methenyltetrahydrofolate cyclohydrolase|nr:bifunctional 5,10-methylenetetrahydrofolate dehydrogenase/5,10-methenyltetrahydrofolate cyclohydrolase [Acholeplasmatales bacterium]